jgi:hypothetical protein
VNYLLKVTANTSATPEASSECATLISLLNTLPSLIEISTKLRYPPVLLYLVVAGTEKQGHRHTAPVSNKVATDHHGCNVPKTSQPTLQERFERRKEEVKLFYVPQNVTSWELRISWMSYCVIPRCRLLLLV